MKKISFCVTCRNRLWQLKQTLGKNLSVLSDDEEIALVDYGSTDGLSDWIWSNFKEFIDSRKLVFFEVKNEVFWNVSKAKNLAHRISSGQYLFNLDGDNFIASVDVQLIYKVVERNRPCSQWSGSMLDGSFGRIGVPRSLFFEIGGYDEAMLPMGGQDIDLMKRINSLGISFAKLPNPSIDAVQNSDVQKISEMKTNLENSESAKSFYGQITNLNLMKAKIRLDMEGPRRREGFSTYNGLFNGEEIIIDGFNNIHRFASDADGKLRRLAI